MKRYTIIDHTADIGIVVTGRTKKETLAGMVEAMFDLMVEQKTVHVVEAKEIAVKGADAEDVLINLMREALYLFHSQAWLCKKCEIMELASRKAMARLGGERYDARKHRLNMEIKAVTYHTAKIKRSDSGWQARVIFDV